MIYQAHLTAWQVHAPWPKRSQIEQDLRLSRGVAAIFADALRRRWCQSDGSLRLVFGEGRHARGQR